MSKVRMLAATKRAALKIGVRLDQINIVHYTISKHLGANFPGPGHNETSELSRMSLLGNEGARVAGPGIRLIWDASAIAEPDAQLERLLFFQPATSVCSLNSCCCLMHSQPVSIVNCASSHFLRGGSLLSIHLLSPQIFPLAQTPCVVHAQFIPA